MAENQKTPRFPVGSLGRGLYGHRRRNYVPERSGAARGDNAVRRNRSEIRTLQPGFAATKQILPTGDSVRLGLAAAMSVGYVRHHDKWETR